MRLIIAALTFSALSSAATAQQWDAFDACATNKDPVARLSCFDQAVLARQASRSTPVAAAPLPPPPAAAAPAAVAPAVAAPAMAPPAARPAPAPPASDVGLNSQQLRKQRAERGEPDPSPAAAPSSFDATIVRVIARTPLISAFELSNGQIWEQTEAMKISVEPQQTVTIRHGALGSFFLKTAAGASVRVHRLK